MTDADSDGNRLSCVDSNGNVRNRRNGAVPRGASTDVALMPLNAFSRPGRGIGELGGNPALTSVKVLSSAMTSSALAIIAFRRCARYDRLRPLREAHTRAGAGSYSSVARLRATTRYEAQAIRALCEETFQAIGSPPDLPFGADSLPGKSDLAPLVLSPATGDRGFEARSNESVENVLRHQRNGTRGGHRDYKGRPLYRPAGGAIS
jgi:hypothetical protein